MTMKLVVETLDDVPTEHHALYTQDDEGKFRLQVEGVEDVSGLKKTVAQLRQEKDGAQKLAREAQKAVEDLKARQEEIFGDLDVEQVKELLAERQQKREDELREQGKLEDMYKSQIKGLEDKHAKELAKLKEHLEEREALLRKRTMTSDLATAVEAAKPVDWLRQHTSLWLERQAEVRRDEDGEYRTYARFSDGELYPLDQYAELWAKTEEGQKFTRGPEINGGGGGTVNGAGSGKSNPWVSGDVAAQHKLMNENREHALALKKAAGK